MNAEVWVVAGCLFEVSLPVNGARQWRWSDDATGHVTLLAEHTEDDRRHFRFRAEAAGARAGTVELRFERDGSEKPIAVARIRVAPERRA